MCHDSLEEEYQDLSSARHWSDTAWYKSVNGRAETRYYCVVCREIEREEMEARDEGLLRRKASGKGGTSYHSYRIYETDTQRPRRVIGEWRDWREHHRVDWISKAPESVKKQYDISNVKMSVRYNGWIKWRPSSQAERNIKSLYDLPEYKKNT